MGLPFEFTDTKATNSYSTNKDELQNGELVDIMLLSCDYPSNYIKALEERNKKESEEAEQIGVPYVPTKPSYKDGGISWKYAVIRRDRLRGTPDELVFKPTDVGFEEPDYSCYGQITHLIPLDQLRATSKAGTLYGDMQREGGDEIAIGGFPAIKPMFDSVKPIRDDSDKSVPVDQRMTADKIPKGQEEKYASIIQKETMRKEWWTAILKWWKGLSEESAKKALDSWISHRLLLCRQLDKNYEYLAPEPGMIFRAQVVRTSDSKYFNIQSFSNWKQVNGKWKREIYSTCDVDKPSEEQILVANALIKAKEEGIKLRAERKANSSKEEFNDFKKHVTEQLSNDVGTEEDPW